MVELDAEKSVLSALGRTDSPSTMAKRVVSEKEWEQLRKEVIISHRLSVGNQPQLPHKDVNSSKNCCMKNCQRNDDSTNAMIVCCLKDFLDFAVAHG